MSNTPNYIFPAKGVSTPDKISVIIPAAGMGNRMKSFGPKALIKLLGNKTVFDYQYKHIRDAIPNSEIILVTGFMSDKVMAETPKDVVKIENENHESTNVVRSIGMGLRAATGDKVLVVYGDLVFNKFTLPGIKMKKESQISIDNYGYFEKKGVGCNEVGCTLDDKGSVAHIDYELSNKWSQIVFLTGKELSIFKSICWNRNNANIFGFEALNLLIDAGGILKPVYSKNSMAIDIDSPADIAPAVEIIKCE